jgi:hypothetical protein
MDLLVYLPAGDEAGQRLQSLVGALEWPGTIEIFKTVPKLSSRLRHPTFEETIALFLAADQRDLRDLAALDPLLKGCRLILILPDGEVGTIALAHSLRPRFVFHREGDFTSVAAVLRKMQQRVCQSPGSGAMNPPPWTDNRRAD